MKTKRLKKGITFVIILSFILSTFFGFDVYHTIQAATVKVQKENMWCNYTKIHKSSDGKIELKEVSHETAKVIYYKGKLYFKENHGISYLNHTKSKKATADYTGENYTITSSNPKVANIDSYKKRYYLDCPKTGTAMLTVKDKKGKVVNKTKITVTKPDFTVDFKALCKDCRNKK